MNVDTREGPAVPVEDEPIESAPEFGLSRRGFVQVFGAGLLIAVAGDWAGAQRAPGRRGGRGGFGGSGASTIAARVHIGSDGTLTVLTGKVEAGQGARAELTQAAAEELRVAVSRVQLVMADTGLVPDDGITAGSGTTPRTVPAVREGCAAARNLLITWAAKQWSVQPADVEVRDGQATHNGHKLTYSDLAGSAESAPLLSQPVPRDVAVTAVKEWKVLGTPVQRPNGRDLVTGSHRFPSDITLADMLYAKILRAPSYGAKLVGVDLAPAQAMNGVIAAHEDTFVGVAAPNSHLAGQALAEVAKTAKWEPTQQPSSTELFDYLRTHAQGDTSNPFAEALGKSAKTLKRMYRIAYVQHAPMEPRAAVAQWEGDKLTVWTGTQNPFGVRGELARALGIPADNVHVIAPDMGGGFGGKHTGECAVEAARMARAAGKPVSLRWTRPEEFTWAYFRPGGVIDIQAGLDDAAKLTTWFQLNINSGPSSVETPYRAGQAKGRFVPSAAALRHGSYRGLAATANTFARECFMDELAELAGKDPLEFRLAHIDNPRLQAVLEKVAERFEFSARVKQKDPKIGVGISCGTEKGSYVAACAEVAIDTDQNTIAVKHVCQAFECGAILNPANLLNQVQGAIVMGIGPALREQMRFEAGKILNASFYQYEVPRLKDLPTLDVHLLDRPDLPSAGAGETPIICIAPAIANAVFHATGSRVREMPIGLKPRRES